MAATVDDLDPLATLFIVASKSGTTTEPLAFLADAWARIEARPPRPPRAAVRARRRDDRRDLRPRARASRRSPTTTSSASSSSTRPTSAAGTPSLTYVGLVPASLIGLDLDALLASASAMLAACREPDPESNPGVSLGLAIGTLAKSGRDKLTFLARPRHRELRRLGRAADRREHRQARRRDRPGRPRAARVDRRPTATTASSSGSRSPATPRSLPPTRTPWPMQPRPPATRSSGSRSPTRSTSPPSSSAGRSRPRSPAPSSAIDPFDQPNVEEAKERTRDVLAGHGGVGRTAARADRLGRRPHALRRRAAPPQRGRRRGRSSASSAGTSPGAARTPTSRSRRSSPRPRPATRRSPSIRTPCSATRRTARRPPGYGPRFLHSTGQLHKGGAPIGWFLQLTSDHPVDRPIPGWPYTFGRLIDAQAQGDFEAIESHDLPIVRVHLADPETDLPRLEAALAEALLGT